jgi:serine/threonine protein kinase
MALPLQAKVGQTLDGRFLLSEEIGHGGMSTIFKAQDLQNQDKPVVVKVALPAFSSGVGAWSMFQREEEIARTARPSLHPQVPAARHWYSADPTWSPSSCPASPWPIA